MSQAIRSPNASSLQSRIFSLENAPVTTTAKRKVFLFNTHSRAMVPQAGSVDALVADWSRDPAFHDAMQAARRRRAARYAHEGESRSLRSLRLERGLSQADVARELKTSQPHVARIENGRGSPTMETCRKLAAVLGVDMNLLNDLLPAVKDDVEDCL